jgi:hypothetical protein
MLLDWSQEFKQHLFLSAKIESIEAHDNISTIKLYSYFYQTNKQTNSVARVSDRTLPTERPQLVGEVSANLRI